MNTKNNKIRAIAYYLPQFHPIPENDEWWGKGFTEWTNVAKAKPLFKGHEQPKLPADLGFYDLRVPEVREQQAQMAREAGIEGFCYWHYWFGNGKRLLERPFNEVLESGKPDFPFCLGWANETWSGIWHGEKDRILIEQEYSIEDYIEHFNYLLPAFKDKRYIRVDDKPLFLVYQTNMIPDLIEFSNIFNKLAIENDLKGIHLVSSYMNPEIDPKSIGFNAATFSPQSNIKNEPLNLYKRFKRKINKNKTLSKFYKLIDSKPLYTFKYEDVLPFLLENRKFDYKFYHTIMCGWDNSPRSGLNSLIFTGYNPNLFRKHVRQVLKNVNESNDNIVFIKSWNEWAEGNYLEPDMQYGKQFLDVIRKEINHITKK